MRSRSTSSRKSSRSKSSRSKSSRSNKSYLSLPPIRTDSGSSSNLSNVSLYTPHPDNVGFPNARSSNSYISELALKGRTPRSLNTETKYVLKKRLKTYKKKYNRNHQNAALAALRKAENALRRSIAKLQSGNTRKRLSATAPSWSPKRVSRPTLITNVNANSTVTANNDMSSYNRKS